MAKRLVKKGVTVVREGKRVRPEIKNFDFTADEIERITEVDPAALGKADSGAEDGEAETPASTTARRPKAGEARPLRPDREARPASRTAKAADDGR
jgi:hypothetical protein